MKSYREIAGDGGSDVLGQVAERSARLHARMVPIANRLAVMSGKGGVGKSTVTANLAAALAMRGRRVAVLDADLNGPCLARMLGVEGQRLKLGDDGIVPAAGALGVKVVSMDLLLPETGSALAWQAPAARNQFAWRGTLEASALVEFAGDTAWGALDFLLIDLPPGADRFADLQDLLPACDKALVVTIPSGVAALSVRRSVILARRLEARLLGAVENMAGLFGEETPAQALGVPVLGRIPFDPRIAQCADRGVPFVGAHPDTPAARAFSAIADEVER
ncbi:MAG: hypothetical protein A3G81_06525 [Betaproteobacteria bacterium RIFCSPLOWO2_12_FULL_65_14]|nr:MAG: hypothetical protein A3G81_06525 [Betaproteobacteria bacterium RIFCSPLOWO2_12_FULL_65_14]